MYDDVISMCNSAIVEPVEPVEPVGHLYFILCV